MCISSCGLGLDQNIASRIGEYDKMIQLNDDWDYDTVRWTHFFCDEMKVKGFPYRTWAIFIMSPWTL